MEVHRLHRRSTDPAVALALGGRDVPGRHGWDALVVTDDGATYHCSLLEGETNWVIDALIPAGTSMPRWMHGWGSRSTVLTLAPQEVADQLDEYLSAGAWPIETP